MLHPRWRTGAPWWVVLLGCFVLSYGLNLAWQFWRGQVAIALHEVIGSLLLAGVLTLLWWVAWGWQRH